MRIVLKKEMYQNLKCRLLFSVEDHFAKALGETWVKLQAKAEQDAKAKAETKVTSTTSEARVTVK